MKVYYVANVRMPTEKAHGIQIAKMAEAMIEAGLDLTLVAPRRPTVPQSIQEYYGLRMPIPLVRLPVIDLYLRGPIGYRISSYSFMLGYLVFLWWKKFRREKFILYTVDLDNFSSSALAFVPAPLFSEMHGSKLPAPAQRLLFKHLTGVIAINTIIVRELKEYFPKSSVQYRVEPNGVDLDAFKPVARDEARRQLGLPPGEKILLYAGRFFAWKGLEILPRAARETPGVRWYLVGGDEELFRLVVGNEEGTDGLVFVGSKPHAEMPLWLAAADAVLVLGTKRDIQSYRYTSPMKLFEYLASGCVIIASDTPAIREIVSEREVLFYCPDDVGDLAEKVCYALEHPAERARLGEAARRSAQERSWRQRGIRVARFINETS